MTTLEKLRIERDGVAAQVAALEAQASRPNWGPAASKRKKLARLDREIAALESPARGTRPAAEGLAPGHSTEVDPAPATLAVIAALSEQVRLQGERLDVMGRLIARMARHMGMMPPEEQQRRPMVPTVARQDAVGIDPINQFKAEMRRHAEAGRSWDMAVDHIDQTLYQAAQKLFSETVGRGSGMRDVSGFRKHIMEGITH